jgi:predicted dehydrogenase
MANAAALGVAEIVLFSTGTGVPAGPIPEQVRVVPSLSDGLSRRTRAVIVANPTSLHVESALLAARGGCHLLIEKPLSDSLDRVDDLQAELQQRGLSALVGYQFRFHPGLRQVRRWLQGGAIGAVASAHARWGEYLPAWQPWRDYRSSYAARAELGGGVLLTLSHVIDYMGWLLGEVKRVDAMTAHRSGLELNVEDTALVHLEFHSGVMASVSLDYVERPPQHGLVVVGSDGTIRWDNSDGVARLDEVVGPQPHFERNDLFLAEMAHFFDCISGAAEPACSLEEGKRAVRICLAARESAREGRRIDL